jgi:alpha-tubulin suppressor-like RCC1 family protein
MKSALNSVAVRSRWSAARLCALSLVVAIAGCGLFGADFSEPPSRPGIGADGGPAGVSGGGPVGTLPAGAPGTCGGGQKSCNGACVAVTDPAYGCSDTKCAPCSIRGGAASCNAGACVIASCQEPKGDCDGNAATGCETNTKTSAAHCGACGRACTGAALCSTGSCKDRCDANLAQCGKSCVDPYTDPAHCGTCDHACPAPADGSATCTAGACGTQCNTGYRACPNKTCKAENAEACGPTCDVCPGPATGGGNAVCINSVCKVQCDAGFTACVSGCCQAGGLQPVKWKHVSLGTEHSCAVTVAGALKCWGQNSEGQLGNGNKLDNSTPVPVQGLASGVAMAATGIRHSCALTESGAVKCWGQGKNGQLGNIDANDSLLPTNVVGLGSRLVLVGAGEDTSCAVTDGGAVVCWGVIPSSKVPTAVWGLGAVVSPVAIGEAHICVTTTAGELKCLGSNFIGGQLGNGSENSSDKPVDVRGLKTGAATVSAFRYHSCAVTIGGAVRCWGENASGQLGTGSKSLLSAVPVDVVGLATGVSMVATGADHSCALMGTGAVKCWGSNLGRQIGDGDGVTAERLTPVDVHGLDVPIVMIAAGYNHTCAVSKAGVLQCWGSNRYGKLGNRTTIDSAVPVTVVSF